MFDAKPLLSNRLLRLCSLMTVWGVWVVWSVWGLWSVWDVWSVWGVWGVWGVNKSEPKFLITPNTCVMLMHHWSKLIV